MNSEKNYKLTDINYNRLSSEGYPIFTLEKALSFDKSDSDLVFYIENKEIVREFINILDNNKKEEVQKFLNINKENITSLGSLKKDGIEVINDVSEKVFNELSNRLRLIALLRFQEYGAAHIIKDEEVLIFPNYPTKIKNLFIKKPWTQKVDLTDTKAYNLFQEEIEKLYNNGEIEPHIIFKNYAADKIIENITRNNLISNIKKTVKNKM